MLLEKPVRTIIAILIGLLLVSIILGAFGNSNLNKAIKQLQEAENISASVVKQLHSTQQKLDLITLELTESKKHIEYIQGIVELSNTEKKLKDARSRAEIDSLKKRGKELEAANQKISKDATVDIIIKD